MLYGYCPKKLQKKWLESLECNKKASTFASAFDKESRWNSQWMRWLKEWGKQTSSTSRLTWWSIGTSMKVNVEKTKIDYGPARDIKRNFLQWRVWSWLRMNASYRLNTCKSRGSIEFPAMEIRMATGARVSNTYPTCLLLGDSLAKVRLTPDGIVFPHGNTIKVYGSGWGCVPLGSRRGNGPPSRRWIGVLRGRSPTLELRHGPNSYGRQQWGILVNGRESEPAK